MARRQLSVPVGLCLAASSGALVAAGRIWATGTVAAIPPLPAQELAITGAGAGTPVRGLAVVGLAGTVAVIAARGWLRPLVGALLLLAGMGIVAASLGFDPGAALADASFPASGRMVAEAGTTPWPALSAACGAGLALAGLLVVLRGRGGGGLSQKYDSPVAGPAAADSGSAGPTVGAVEQDAAASERALWEALDRGEDPTGKDRIAPDRDVAPGPPPTDEARPPPG